MEAIDTKGNWEVSSISEHSILTISICSDLICSIHGDSKDENIKANAKLIAAAPELLNALDNLINAVGGGNKHCEHDFECNCAMDEAKKVIKKATE